MYTNWSTEHESLSHKLAFRVLAALSKGLNQLKVEDAPLHVANLEGFLAYQVWLADHHIQGDLRNVLSSELEKMRKRASEHRVVRISVESLWIDPEVISPDEENSEENSEENTRQDEQSSQPAAQSAASQGLTDDHGTDIQSDVSDESTSPIDIKTNSEIQVQAEKNKSIDINKQKVALEIAEEDLEPPIQNFPSQSKK